MGDASILIIVILLAHVIQNDARLWQVVKEVRQLRKSLDDRNKGATDNNPTA